MPEVGIYISPNLEDRIGAEKPSGMDAKEFMELLMELGLPVLAEEANLRHEGLNSEKQDC